MTIRPIQLLAVAVCLLSAGCLPETVRTSEGLVTKHDQVNTLVAQRPLDEVHAFVVKAATKCYSMVTGDSLMPAGKGLYVPVGGGIHREVDDKVVVDNMLAVVSIVVRGGPPPLGPESFILRVDLKAVGANETEITSYNAHAVRAQRAFHEQVRRWVIDKIEDCSGAGPFG